MATRLSFFATNPPKDFCTQSLKGGNAYCIKQNYPRRHVCPIVRAFAGGTRAAGMAGSQGWHWQLVASVAKQQEAKRPLGLRPPATSCRCHPSTSCGRHYGDNTVVMPCDRLRINTLHDIRTHNLTRVNYSFLAITLHLVNTGPYINAFERIAAVIAEQHKEQGFW